MGQGCRHISETEKARMKGRRINYLRTAIDIQNIVKKWGKYGKGHSQRWIYDNIINVADSGYHISYSTYNNYLSVSSPTTELKKITSNDN